MGLNKKNFTELIRRITRKNTLTKLNIVIWHGDSSEYSNAIYIELMFTVNEVEYAQCLEESKNFNLYYGDTLEDTEENPDLIEIYELFDEKFLNLDIEKLEEEYKMIYYFYQISKDVNVNFYNLESIYNWIAENFKDVNVDSVNLLDKLYS